LSEFSTEQNQQAGVCPNAQTRELRFGILFLNIKELMREREKEWEREGRETDYEESACVIVEAGKASLTICSLTASWGPRLVHL
jgi:hypothetical protein